MAYNLVINGVYWGYKPFTNHLLTSWDIQVEYICNYLGGGFRDLTKTPQCPSKSWLGG